MSQKDDWQNDEGRQREAHERRGRDECFKHALFFPSRAFFTAHCPLPTADRSPPTISAGANLFLVDLCDFREEPIVGTYFQ